MLVYDTGNGSLVDQTDEAKWRALANPAQAAKSGVYARRIPASDENITAAGTTLAGELGTWSHPGRTPYVVLPDRSQTGANSNSATAAIEYHALDMGDVPNAATVVGDNPPNAPGWNQYGRLPWR